MRKTASLLLVLVFLTSLCIMVAEHAYSSANSTADTWIQRSSMHEARSCLGVATVNGKIYAIGGSTESGFIPNAHGSQVYDIKSNDVGTNEEYDPATNTWTYKASMPTPRLAFGIAVYNNKIYCIGGQSNHTYTGANEVYDPATNIWETKTPMPTARSWVAANVVNGKIYVMSGYTPISSSLNEVYDPETDTWETMTPSPEVPLSDYSLASCVFDNKIYLMGGLSSDGMHNLNQIYDPKTNTWSIGAYSPSSIEGGAAATSTGAFAPKRIYLMGPSAYLSQDNSFYSNQVYNPKTDHWAAAAEMPTERFHFGIAVVNDTFYVIGGNTYQYPGDYAPLALNEYYTPLSFGTPDPSFDTTPPEITIFSPENTTYYTTNLSLSFSVNEQVSWMAYRLDGETKISTSGNTTIGGLSPGSHSLTLYVADQVGNTQISTIQFAVAGEAKTEYFSVILVAAFGVVTVGAVVLLIYFKKCRPIKK